MNNITDLKDRRPNMKTGLDEFLSQSEDDMLAELEALQTPIEPILFDGMDAPILLGGPLEINTRLTIIKMFEQTPEMKRPFTFSVRRFCGPAYVQAMRTTLAKARKFAREAEMSLGEPFRMLVISIDTQTDRDVVSVTRIPKGEKMAVKLTELALLMGPGK